MLTAFAHSGHDRQGALDERLRKWDLNGDGRLDAYELWLIHAASEQRPKKPTVNRSEERRRILLEKYNSPAAAGRVEQQDNHTGRAPRRTGGTLRPKLAPYLQTNVPGNSSNSKK